MSQSEGAPGIVLELGIDEEGVVRVLNFEGDAIILSPTQLARLLTVLIGSFTSNGGEDSSTVDILLE